MNIELKVSEDYMDFVKSRAKSGQAIIDTLTPAKMHLLHMTIGIVGEVAELIAANSAENILEESGDVEFYFAGALLDTDIHCIYQTLTQDNAVKESFIYNLIYRAGELLDQVKKYVIYNKDTLTTVVQGLLNFRAALDHYYSFQRLDSAVIRNQNMEKLKKRYPTGYTDAAAQARADKKEGE